MCMMVDYVREITMKKSIMANMNLLMRIVRVLFAASVLPVLNLHSVFHNFFCTCVCICVCVCVCVLCTLCVHVCGCVCYVC